MKIFSLDVNSYHHKPPTATMSVVIRTLFIIKHMSDAFHIECPDLLSYKIFKYTVTITQLKKTGRKIPRKYCKLQHASNILPSYSEICILFC